MERALNIK